MKGAQSGKGSGGSEAHAESMAVDAPEGATMGEALHAERERTETMGEHAQAGIKDEHEAKEDKALRDEASREDDRAKQKEKLMGGQRSQAQGQNKDARRDAVAQAKLAESVRDGFEAGADKADKAQQTQKAQETQKTGKVTKAAAAREAAEVKRTTLPPPPRSDAPPGSPQYVLNNAQDPGVFYKEFGDGHTEEDDDPELAAAVEEAIRMLFGVTGIHHVGAGENDARESVIVIVAGRGFTEESLKAIPDFVHRFKTVLALPYDQLPLRRFR